MVPYFPPELVLHVFTFLPTDYPYQERTPTLWACSLVCRAWRPLAQRALLSHVDFLRKKRYLVGSKGVDGLLAMASKVPGGWRCELLRTSGITEWAQKRRLFEGASLIRKLKFSGSLGRNFSEDDPDEEDVFRLECMQGLEELELESAYIPPTRSTLPNLRSLVCDEVCDSTIALPSLLAAAPNLTKLDLVLEPPEFFEAVAKSNVSHLTKLEKLRLCLGADYRGMPIVEGLPKFVTDCSSHLRLLSLGPFRPYCHLDILRAVRNPLEVLVMDIIFVHWGYLWPVGEVLLEVAQTKAASGLKEWRVTVNTDDGSRPGTTERVHVERGEWEDDDWDSWLELCEERAIHVEVEDNLADWNPDYEDDDPRQEPPCSFVTFSM